MKNPHDPRHIRRQKIVEELFELQFYNQPVSNETKKITIHKDTIDEKIRNAAPEFPIEKINRIDLAILRLAVYELTIEKSQPQKVVLDEAIELAKEYGGDTSPSFINGALGKLLSHEPLKKTQTSSSET